MFNGYEQIDGAALAIGGGPCATRGFCVDPESSPEPFDYNSFNPETDKIPVYTENWKILNDARRYDTNGLDGMPIYVFSGDRDDIVPP